MKKQLFIIIHRDEQLSAIEKVLQKRPDLDYDINIFLAFTGTPLDKYGIALPRMDRLQPFSAHSVRENVFIRTLEQLGGIFSLLDDDSTSMSPLKSRIVVIDSSIPIWNSFSYMALSEQLKLSPYFVASYEFTVHEIKALYESLPEKIQSKMLIPLYGFIPLMVSAGCIKETQKACDKTDGIVYITDRKGISFPVVNDCSSCTNIIYNSLPYSGHELTIKENFCPQASYKLEFTIESNSNTVDIFTYYLDLLEKLHEKRPVFEYTTGHLKRKTL